MKITNNLVENRNILRQIIDVQSQAERLINEKANLIEIEQFANYSNEIKLFLIQNINDDFITKLVKEIPDLNIEEFDSERGLLYLILGWLGGGLGAYSRERNKSDKALKKIRDIRGKYASIEFMLKNYFS